MNREIPLKFRLIAAGLHAIGATSSSLVVFGTIFSMMPFTYRIDSLILPILTGIAVTSPITTWIGWRITKQIHPFVDRSGRSALNCVLSTFAAMLICLLFCTFIFSITCGIGNQDPSAILVAPGISFLILVAYFMNSLVTGILALNGYDFKSFLIYPFIKY
jgi:uncharacterized Tic20 family protein